MCLKPLNIGGQMVACRTCDACIAARRSDWVARAMAERETSAYTYVLALTYNDDTQENRDGAAMFRYGDVSAFLKRLRRRLSHRYGDATYVRFACAGEQGSRYGRCHWHIVLYLSHDICQVGKWSVKGRSLTRYEQIVSTDAKRPLRCTLDLWPHGFVSVQEPDEGGIAYALVYALKDQFNVARSAGQSREVKAEPFATGKFNMSKTPPLGAFWLDAKLSELRAKGAVIPRVELRVADRKRVWFPRGWARKYLLAGLRAINDDIRATIGRNAPQWAALVHGVRDNPSDLLELLDEQEGEEESVEFSIARRQRSASAVSDAKRIRQRCGRRYVCFDCWAALFEEERAAAGYAVTSYGLAGLDAFEDPTSKEAQAFRLDASSNPYTGSLHEACCLRDTRGRREAFKLSSREA